MSVSGYVPFTQYLRPDGRKRPITIEMPEDIADKAFYFIEEMDGWYEAEVLIDGTVSLTACRIIDGEPQDTVIVLHKNGPGMKEAVRGLIERSVGPGQ